MRRLARGALARHGGELGALGEYEAAVEQGRRPRVELVLAALKVCSKLKDLRSGERIHSHLLKQGAPLDLCVASSLVNMYSKCGSLMEAKKVFDGVPPCKRNVVLWTAAVMGYAQCGQGQKALELFEQMQAEGCVPNAITFLAALKACCSLVEQGGRLGACLHRGRTIHQQAARSGHESDLFVGTTLVDFYGKAKSMSEARQVFDRMPEKNIVAWNSLMLGYVQNGEPELALEVFSSLQKERNCEPNAVTFVAGLKACGSLAEKVDHKGHEGKQAKVAYLQMCRQIHSRATGLGLDRGTFVASSLVDVYAKCGSLADARLVFDMMEQRDRVCWNCIIMGYAENGQGAEVALELYDRMLAEGYSPDRITYLAALKACSSLAEQEDGKMVDGRLLKPRCLERGRELHGLVTSSSGELNNYLANSLVDMYCKCGSVSEARGVFDGMQVKDLVSWNCIIMGYAQQQQSSEADEALRLYVRMKGEGFTPDHVTFVGALKACAALGSLEAGMEVEAEIRRVKLDKDLVVATTLVDFHGKCGNMARAEQVFNSMPVKNVVTWGALMSGYSRQGDTDRVMELFDSMLRQKVQPDQITVLPVLTACSHAGLVEQGKQYFEAMTREYGLRPNLEHYNCMVDILGRNNQLEEALTMVENMPFQANDVTWTSILGSCRKWGNVTIARVAFEQLVKLDGRNSATYVLMWNMYLAAGMQDEAARVMALKRSARAWKEPGQSWWVDDACLAHTFLAESSGVFVH